MRRTLPESSYADFQKRLRPHIRKVFLDIFRENPESIKVKKEAVAVRNLEKIFQAVLKLAHKKGFHAMSLRDLSRESGLSMGALYSYFKSKDELRRHIFKHVGRFAVAVLKSEADRHERPPEKLCAAIRAHLFLSEKQRHWFYFSYMEAKNLPRNERVQAMRNERLTESIFLDIIEEGVKSRVFHTSDVRLAAAVIKALLQDWYLKRWKYRDAGITVEQYADFIITFVLDSISAKGKE